MQEALLALAHFATDPAQAQRLTRLGSQEGKQEYQEWITKSLRSLLEVWLHGHFPALAALLGAHTPAMLLPVAVRHCLLPACCLGAS